MPPKKATAAAPQKKAAAAPVQPSYRGQSMLDILTQRCRVASEISALWSRVSSNMILQI